MSKLDKDQVIEQFTQAYTAAHGKAPEIEAKGGWYSVDGGKNVRLAALVDMTTELTSGNAPSSAAVESGSTTKKASSKSTAAKAKKPASTSGFSVKGFWEEHVIAQQNASRPPR